LSKHFWNFPQARSGVFQFKSAPKRISSPINKKKEEEDAESIQSADIKIEVTTEDDTEEIRNQHNNGQQSFQMPNLQGISNQGRRHTLVIIFNL